MKADIFAPRARTNWKRGYVRLWVVVSIMWLLVAAIDVIDRAGTSNGMGGNRSMGFSEAVVVLFMFPVLAALPFAVPIIFRWVRDGFTGHEIPRDAPKHPGGANEWTRPLPPFE